MEDGPYATVNSDELPDMVGCEAEIHNVGPDHWASSIFAAITGHKLPGRLVMCIGLPLSESLYVSTFSFRRGRSG